MEYDALYPSSPVASEVATTLYRRRASRTGIPPLSLTPPREPSPSRLSDVIKLLLPHPSQRAPQLSPHTWNAMVDKHQSSGREGDEDVNPFIKHAPSSSPSPPPVEISVEDLRTEVVVEAASSAPTLDVEAAEVPTLDSSSLSTSASPTGATKLRRPPPKRAASQKALDATSRSGADEGALPAAGVGGDTQAVPSRPPPPSSKGRSATSFGALVHKAVAAEAGEAAKDGEGSSAKVEDATLPTATGAGPGIDTAVVTANAAAATSSGEFGVDLEGRSASPTPSPPPPPPLRVFVSDTPEFTPPVDTATTTTTTGIYPSSSIPPPPFTVHVVESNPTAFAAAPAPTSASSWHPPKFTGGGASSGGKSGKPSPTIATTTTTTPALSRPRLSQRLALVDHDKALVRRLGSVTGKGVLECCRLLSDADWDFERALSSTLCSPPPRQTGGGGGLYASPAAAAAAAALPTPLTFAQLQELQDWVLIAPGLPQLRSVSPNTTTTTTATGGRATPSSSTTPPTAYTRHLIFPLPPITPTSHSHSQPPSSPRPTHSMHACYSPAFLLSLGHFQEALPALATHLTSLCTTLGMEHSATLTALQTYGEACWGAAVQGLEEASSSTTTTTSSSSSSSSPTLDGGAVAEVLGFSHRVRKAVLGVGHPDTLLSGVTLALYFSEWEGGRTRAATDATHGLWEGCVGGLKATLGPHHPATLRASEGYSDFLASCGGGRLREAVAGKRALAQAWCDSVGASHPEALLALYCFASLLQCEFPRGEHASEVDRLLGAVMTLGNYCHLLVEEGQQQRQQPQQGLGSGGGGGGGGGGAGFPPPPSAAILSRAAARILVVAKFMRITGMEGNPAQAAAHAVRHNWHVEAAVRGFGGTR